MLGLCIKLGGNYECSGFCGCLNYYCLLGFLNYVLIGCSIVGQVPVASIVVETTLVKVDAEMHSVSGFYQI
jgi:hypothetical protein